MGQHIVNEFRRHIHATYIVGIVEEGERIIESAAGTVRVGQGSLFLINPGQVHACKSNGNVGQSYKILSIPPCFMQRLRLYVDGDTTLPPCFLTVSLEDDLLFAAFVQLFSKIERQLPFDEMEKLLTGFVQLLLARTVTKIWPSFEEQDRRMDIEQACAFIRENYAENVPHIQVADAACLSLFHFQREFKRQMGITPHEYLHDFRVHQAIKMLMASADVADVAFRVGFFDQSHFSRVFRKAVGVPPGRFRNTHQKEQ
ncbi:MAG: AraC family transcriptional regulator [Desulfobulbus sp.]|nr:AraC family transcriptional regulator [Desulfobulbus sp.]